MKLASFQNNSSLGLFKQFKQRDHSVNRPSADISTRKNTVHFSGSRGGNKNGTSVLGMLLKLPKKMLMLLGLIALIGTGLVSHKVGKDGVWGLTKDWILNWDNNEENTSNQANSSTWFNWDALTPKTYERTGPNGEWKEVGAEDSPPVNHLEADAAMREKYGYDYFTNVGAAIERDKAENPWRYEEPEVTEINVDMMFTQYDFKDKQQQFESALHRPITKGGMYLMRDLMSEDGEFSYREGLHGLRKLPPEDMHGKPITLPTDEVPPITYDDIRILFNAIYGTNLSRDEFQPAFSETWVHPEVWANPVKPNTHFNVHDLIPHLKG